MRVRDESTVDTNVQVSEGGRVPPERPGLHGDGGSGPEDDRLKLMLLIRNARVSGAVSLRYLRSQTGFARHRLWRAFEDLEDVGYIELSDGDTRDPVTRWLDNRTTLNERVFASTFVVLTEAGRCNLELQTFITVSEDSGGGRRCGGPESSVFGSLRGLIFWRK